jgi:hypothetical protein
VSDVRLFLRLVQRPAAEVMTQLEQFVVHAPGRCRWVPQGTAFVLEEDLRSRTLRRTGWHKEQEKLARKRRAGYEQNKRSRLVPVVAMRLFDSLPQAAQDAVLHGCRLEYSFAELPPAARHEVQRACFGWGGGQEGGRRWDGSRDFAEARLVVAGYGGSDSPTFGVMVAGPVGGRKWADLANPPEILPDKSRWYPSLHKLLRRARGPSDAATRPELQRQIHIRGGTVEQVLTQVADSAALPVLAEYDPCLRGGPGAIGIQMLTPWSKGERVKEGRIPRSGTEPVHRVLDVVCERFDLDWSFQNGWIWVRSPRATAARLGLIDLAPPGGDSVGRD